MPQPQNNVVHTPLFSCYSEVRTLVKIWAGSATKTGVYDLIKAIWEQTGTPQNPVDWTNPDEWIDKRLPGATGALARRIWNESAQSVNPRHMYGSYLFINTYDLLLPDHTGTYQLTERGSHFLAEDAGTVRELDEAEGLPNLLSILAAHSPAKRGDLLEDWGTFLRAHSKYGTASTIKDTLRRRLLNLVERGYVSRKGNTFTITPKGIAYASDPSPLATEQPHTDVLQAIKAYNDAQTSALRDRLGKMNAYRFESLIKDLLEAMDYENVVVTKQSGDKGIDVVANFQFGITEITEVVQVKRQQGSVGRPILDQLRGSLHYFQAIRGTIITLGSFTAGCRDSALAPGVAPISLIDGDRLIELLLKHEVGVTKKSQTLIEVDDTYFAASAADPEVTLEVGPDDAD